MYGVRLEGSDKELDVNALSLEEYRMLAGGIRYLLKGDR